MFQNRTAAEMRGWLRNVRNDAQGDCFICCVLSHGCQEGVLGVDDQVITTKEIVSLFSGPNCPALLNKHKVFFFQACRGSKLDSPDQVAEAQTQMPYQQQGLHQTEEPPQPHPTLTSSTALPLWKTMSLSDV